MKRFLNLVVYILTIHVSALLIAGLFRLVLFISSYHQLTSELRWYVEFATIMGKRCSVSLRSFSVSFMDWFI